MRHAAAAAFYALAPPELQQIHWPPSRSLTLTQSKAMSPTRQLASDCGSHHTRALPSSITLTESALSSPRAAEPGAAAFCRSARARSFYNRPAFSRRFVPVQHSVSRRYGSEARERETDVESPPLMTGEPPVRVSSVN